MILRFLSIFVLFFSLASCQFTETMVLNEDGSGRMNVAIDLSEMAGLMALSDSISVKMDTIVKMKDFLEMNSDSISKLPAKDQMKLQKLKDFTMHMIMDAEQGIWNIETYVDFKNISEANDILNGLEMAQTALPDVNGSFKKEDSEKDKEQKDVMGVSYSFEKGKFKRDAFIKDKEAHKKEVDSMKSAEAFLDGMTYKLKYTFPRKVKKSSLKDATLSLDGKTLMVEKKFLEYMKNPDILDLEVELQN